MAIRDVTAIALPGLSAFELSIACEGFGIDRSADGVPTFDFAVVSADAAPIETSAGFTIVPSHGLDRTASADLVIVPTAGGCLEPDPRVLDVLIDAVDRGARVMSICTGAFVLGAAGLLDDRRCTTHWMEVERLSEMYPRATVERDLLYVDDGQVLTGAGSAAGLDLVLHIIRTEHGADVANTVARRMVVAPHRDGGQAQFINTPIRPEDAETLAPLLTWMLEHLDEELTVDALAERMCMSSRTFLRRFQAEIGASPHAWLQRQRVVAAQRLLERTDEPVELIAGRCGFGSAATLRQHFGRVVGTNPVAYRRSFRAA